MIWLMTFRMEVCTGEASIRRRLQAVKRDATAHRLARHGEDVAGRHEVDRRDQESEQETPDREARVVDLSSQRQR